VTAGVPDELIGVWRRESLSVGEGEPFEDANVVWVQSRTRYADIRILLSGDAKGSEAFAGTQVWRPPLLTFNHDLDYTAKSPDDVGQFSWDGPTLVERGSVTMNGNEIAFAERWERVSPCNPQYLALQKQDNEGELRGIAVQVDQHLIIIAAGDRFSATHFEKVDEAWQQRSFVGAAQSAGFARRILSGDVPDWCGVESDG